MQAVSDATGLIRSGDRQMHMDCTLTFIKSDFYVRAKSYVPSSLKNVVNLENRHAPLTSVLGNVLPIRAPVAISALGANFNVANV